MDSCRKFSFATYLCNKLDKFNPPPFITVESSTVKKDKDVVSQPNTRSATLHLHKLKSLAKTQGHKIMVQYFAKEIGLLNGFIERKGTQLRLEKALQLSNQILKVGLRLRSNEFYQQMERFMLSGNQISKQYKVTRLPSCQWAQWIVYLCLREAALLVKIKLECEKAVKFWLGLISSSHHWGDSLVITGILSRIWHLSKIVFKSISNKIYPILFDLVKTLTPNDAPRWPSEEFEIPHDLKQWLECDMNLCYKDNIDSSFVKEDSQVIVQIFQADKMCKTENCAPKMELESYSSPADEDLGEVVKKLPGSKKPKGKEIKNNNISNRLSEFSMVFRNHKKLQKTDVGRKKLYKKIKKYLGFQTNEKIKLKLRNILRSLSAASNNDLDKVDHLIGKFQEYNAVFCAK